MPSTREVAIVSVAGFLATVGVAMLFDLSGYATLLVAAAISLNYWGVRGLWRNRRHRVIRTPTEPRKPAK